MNRTEIVAEIGWNHMGNMPLAKQMIEAAQGAGADYAKFQYWKSANLKEGPWDKDGRREIYQEAELDMHKVHELNFYCTEANIKFLCSVFDVQDIKDLARVTEIIKIPSHEANNHELIKEAVDRFQYIYISLGATTGTEKDRLLNEYKKESSRITVLYCVSVYPMPLHAFKPNTLRMMLLQFGVAGYQVGYSGHHPTIFDAIMALSQDVDVIEKHFTTNNDLPGRDNKFALTPTELESLCDARDEMSLGVPGEKYGFFPAEQEVRDVYAGRWSKRNY